MAQQAEAEKAAKQSSASNGNNGANYAEKKHGLTPYQVKQKVAELEAQIEALEDQLEQIGTDLETASSNGDTDKVTQLGAAYTQTEAELEATMDEWGKFVD
jgi:molecular chaperone GrpE (heat shock protein)